MHMESVLARHENGLIDDIEDAEAAKRMAHLLGRYYPGHPWIVGYQGHVLVIRHDAIDQYIGALMRQYAKGFCYVVKHHDHPDPKTFQRAAIEAGGKMLEAFGYPRGKWDGREPSFPFGLFNQKVGVLSNGS